MSASQPTCWGERPEQEAMGWDFEGAKRFQISLGVSLTPAERLAWLERTLAEMSELCGLARKGRVIPPDISTEEDA